jgi:hypothetical protein
MKNLLFSLIAIGMLVVACKKPAEASVATINFMEPVVGDTIAFGQELHCEGTVLGNGELHGYTLTMINLSNNQTVYSASSAAHAESYVFHEHWVNNVTDTATIKVLLEVELDHDGNKSAKEINVVCLPN